MIEMIPEVKTGNAAESETAVEAAAAVEPSILNLFAYFD